MLSIRTILSRHTLSTICKGPIHHRRYFHPTVAKMVKVGDSIPSIELYENTPGTKVDLSKELKGKGLIVGVPAAFSESSISNLRCHADVQL